MTVEVLKRGVLVFIRLHKQYQNGLNNYEIICQFMKRSRRQTEKKQAT